MSATMVGRGQNILKLHWLKRPKTVPKKRNLDQKVNDSEPCIWSLSINVRFYLSMSDLRKNTACCLGLVKCFKIFQFNFINFLLLAVKLSELHEKPRKED